MDNWDGISGQEKLIRYFNKAVEKKQISHAYMIEGEPGTPKMQLAERFARMIQCEKGTGCGECHSCKAFDSGNHPDVIRVVHEKPDLIRIDEIRKQLVEDMGIRPYSSPYKVYLVDEADKMNPAAQNALLKTLEEPPYYGVIILVTVNSNKFLSTILSRSIILKCQSGTGKEFLLEPEQQQQILSVLKSVRNYDRTQMTEVAAGWKKENIPLSLIMNLARVWIRDILVWKDVHNDRFFILRDEIRAIKEAGSEYSYAQCNHILEMADVTERRVNSNVSFELAVELFLESMKVTKKAEEQEDDPWNDMPFPDFEEARFYAESMEDTML